MKMAMEKKRIHLSDLHLGPGRKPGPGKYDYDWLDANEARTFADFLNYLDGANDVGEIILLGDTMDNWVCPIDEDPITFQEIIDADKNKCVVDAMKKLTKNPAKKLIYMTGNHDMLVDKKFIIDQFPGIVFGGGAIYGSVYRTSRLHAEHGSSHAMFTAPDPINNPANQLPLGYYISRIAATKVANTGSGKRHFWTDIDHLLESIGPQTLSQSVFDAIMDESGIPPDADIKMRATNGTIYMVKASDARSKYAGLYDQWCKTYGPGIAFKAIMAEIGYLGDIADYLCKKGDTNIVIFGHSHDCELDKDSWFVEDRIYANCGCWCDQDRKEVRTFVETQKDNEARIHYVRLKQWMGTDVRTIREEHMQL